MREYTYGAIENVALYSSNNPMPISPLAQLLTMHDPVADRIIVLDRRDSTKTPDGFNFEELYQMVREVKQADGFTGHAISELHSPSFLQGDGGRAAVSWYSPTLAPFF